MESKIDSKEDHEKLLSAITDLAISSARARYPSIKWLRFCGRMTLVVVSSSPAVRIPNMNFTEDWYTFEEEGSVGAGGDGAVVSAVAVLVFIESSACDVSAGVFGSSGATTCIETMPSVIQIGVHPACFALRF